jgi:hypothetical protein
MCKSLHSPYLSGLYVHACNCARVCECACVCARACVHVHICINLQLFSVCSPIMSVELSTMKTKGMCGPEVRQTHIRTQKEDRHGERMRAAHLNTCSHAASVHILCKHRFRYGYGLVITDNQRLLPAHTRPTTLQGGYCDKETLLSETACKDGKADWTSVKGTLILTGNVFNPFGYGLAFKKVFPPTPSCGFCLHVRVQSNASKTSKTKEFLVFGAPLKMMN